jgi:hypothetical protein
MAARKPKRASRAKPTKKAIAKNNRKKVATKAARPPAASPAKRVTAGRSVGKKAAELVTKKGAKAVGKKPTKRAAAKKAGTQANAKREKPTRARDALSALAQKKAIEATLSPTPDGRSVVDAYMRDVDHPFKAEMEAVRQIILGASPKISERIKWNAPSFYYKEDLGAFHPRASEYAHLILLFPGGGGMADDTGLLEGTHKERREAKFHSLSDVAAKKPALEKLVKRWVQLRDR